MEYVAVYIILGLGAILVLTLLTGVPLFLIHLWQSARKIGEGKPGRTPAKETGSQIVMHFPTWVRGFGGFIILVGAGFLYGSLTLMGKDVVWPIVFLCLGLPALLFGIWTVGYTFRLFFDDALGDVTISYCFGSFIYRTRHFLSEQVQNVRAFISEEGPYVRVWAVSLKISGRKKDIKIINNVDERRATYVASRIRAFFEQYQKISKD